MAKKIRKIVNWLSVMVHEEYSACTLCGSDRCKAYTLVEYRRGYWRAFCRKCIKKVIYD